MNKISLRDFETIVPLVWTKETCYEPWQKDWSQNNPAKGQCFVTVKLFQEFLGGKIIKAKDSNNISHYWNLLDDIEHDFTKSQYPANEIFSNKEIVNTIEENPRCIILKINFLKKILETEGFPIVYEWHDKPGTVYENHTHQGKVSFYVIEGSVSFSGGIQKVVSTGERFDVPVGIEHGAKVGENGCQYVVGQEIEGDV